MAKETPHKLPLDKPNFLKKFFNLHFDYFKEENNELVLDSDPESIYKDLRSIQNGGFTWYTRTLAKGGSDFVNYKITLNPLYRRSLAIGEVNVDLSGYLLQPDFRRSFREHFDGEGYQEELRETLEELEQKYEETLLFPLDPDLNGAFSSLGTIDWSDFDNSFIPKDLGFEYTKRVMVKCHLANSVDWGEFTSDKLESWRLEKVAEGVSKGYHITEKYVEKALEQMSEEDQEIVDSSKEKDRKEI